MYARMGLHGLGDDAPMGTVSLVGGPNFLLGQSGEIRVSGAFPGGLVATRITGTGDGPMTNETTYFRWDNLNRADSSGNFSIPINAGLAHGTWPGRYRVYVATAPWNNYQNQPAPGTDRYMGYVDFTIQSDPNVSPETDFTASALRNYRSAYVPRYLSDAAKYSGVPVDQIVIPRLLRNMPRTQLVVNDPNSGKPTGEWPPCSELSEADAAFIGCEHDKFTFDAPFAGKNVVYDAAGNASLAAPAIASPAASPAQSSGTSLEQLIRSVAPAHLSQSATLSHAPSKNMLVWGGLAAATLLVLIGGRR